MTKKKDTREMYSVAPDWARKTVEELEEKLKFFPEDILRAGQEAIKNGSKPEEVENDQLSIEAEVLGRLVANFVQRIVDLKGAPESAAYELALQEMERRAAYRLAVRKKIN